MGTMDPGVLFCAVGRKADGIRLASYALPRTDNGLFVETFGKVLRSTSVIDNPRAQFSVPATGDMMHYEYDGQFVYFVVCKKTYPVRVVSRFLAELKGLCESKFSAQELKVLRENGANSKLSNGMGGLLKRYEQLSNVDKVAEVELQVEQTKEVMRVNIDQVLAAQEKLDDLQDKSVTLKNEAKVFNQQSGALKNEMWWKSTKIWLIIAGIAIVALVIFLVLIFFVLLPFFIILFGILVQLGVIAAIQAQIEKVVNG